MLIMERSNQMVSTLYIPEVRVEDSRGSTRCWKKLRLGCSEANRGGR